MSEMKPSLRLLLGYAVVGCGLVWGQDLGSSSALVRDHAGPTHQITGRQAGLSIPRNQIWRAISNALRLRGFEEGELPSARDLDYSGAVPTAQGELLEVTSITWDAVLQSLQFRLRCKESGNCLPFLVRVHGSESTVSPIVLSRIRREQAVPEPERSSLATNSGNQRSRGGAARAAIARISLVERGQPATLILKGDGVRVSARVICLERGSEGQEIRARSKEGRRLFHARVIGAGVLEAAF